MTPAQIKMAIDGLYARIEIEVLRLHLKIRRHDQATEARMVALEARLAALDAANAANGGAK